MPVRLPSQVRDYPAATKEYEASGTQNAEVPRMLFEADMLQDLEMYVHQKGAHASAPPYLDRSFMQLSRIST